MEARKTLFVSPPTSRFKEEVEAEEEGQYVSKDPEEYPLRFPPVARRKERVPVGKATTFGRSEDRQTCKTVMKLESPPPLA